MTTGGRGPLVGVVPTLPNVREGSPAKAYVKYGSVDRWPSLTRSPLMN